jgi:hypothetical protein
MSEAGLRAVEDHWNWDSMETRLLEAYAAYLEPGTSAA